MTDAGKMPAPLDILEGAGRLIQSNLVGRPCPDCQEEMVFEVEDEPRDLEACIAGGFQAHHIPELSSCECQHSEDLIDEISIEIAEGYEPWQD